MYLSELLILSAGLAADACAVSMTNGMCSRKFCLSRAAVIACCFGIMQGLMPLIGFLIGSVFYRIISAYDHILALLLLVGIGLHMLLDALHEQSEQTQKDLSFRMIMLQSIAVSIDALAVGIGFSAFSGFRIIPAVSVIAAVTAAMSFLSVWIGKRFGDVLNRKAKICGGLLLIFIGVRIFFSHII